MKNLLPLAVTLLMISIGMSLRPGQLLENWRRLTPSLWLRLVAATFLVPPILALALGTLLALDRPTTAGLLIVAVVPGAPLMTRAAVQKGFDIHLAASYQVWGALLTPVLVPLLIAACGQLYGRDIWVPPIRLIELIAEQQFAPFLAGMALVWLAPSFSAHVQRALNLVGNVLLAVMLAVVLYKMGPAIAAGSPWLLLAAPLLAVGCLMAVRVLLGQRSRTVATLAICNANRHVGLAILVSGEQIHDQRPIPAIAAYALAAVVVMWAYAKMAGRGGEAAAEEPQQA